MTIKAILTDIEGTTSAVSFVFDVLFPYAARHLPDFVREHAGEPEVAAQLAAVRAESGEADADVERAIAILLQWIAEDRKATPLKALQGMVWAQGYRDGQLKGHVYPDAVQALREWKARGLDLYVYSSGSIQAQKLIFGCSEAGDLGPLFSGYFDTTSGPKRKAPPMRGSPGPSACRPRKSFSFPTWCRSWMPRATRACARSAWPAKAAAWTAIRRWPASPTSSWSERAGYPEGTLLLGSIAPWGPPSAG